MVMELGTMKDEFTAFREKAAADKETMEVEFDSSGDVLFNYGYGCCVFTHNICGRKPHIPDGMPTPSILLTPHCPPSISSTASAQDPAVGSKEEHPGISPTSAGEEVNLLIGPPALSNGLIEDAITN